MVSDASRVLIGTAGWNIPRDYKDLFAGDESHLERYARVFNCVEINSSFYRHHQWKTYARWADSVPEDFRFAIKLSKLLTHEHKLSVLKPMVMEALEGPAALGEKWGALLIQLAPSHAFEAVLAESFFTLVREFYFGFIALEPRHLSWVSTEAIATLKHFVISTVFADPSRIPLPNHDTAEAGGAAYLRLHGSPEIYKSKYETRALNDFCAISILTHAVPVWCIFDNTTFGHATLNAAEMKALVEAGRES